MKTIARRILAGKGVRSEKENSLGQKEEIFLYLPNTPLPFLFAMASQGLWMHKVGGAEDFCFHAWFY